MDSYRSLFEYVPTGIVIGDMEGRILDANPAALLLLNRPLEEARSTRLDAHVFLNEIGAADGYRRCLERGQLLYDEGSFTKSDGERLYFQYHLVPIPATDREPDSFIHLHMEDITDRVKAEQGLLRISNYFDKIFASISPLATLNADLSVRFVNEAFRREFGLRPERTVAGLHFVDYLGIGGVDLTEFKRNVEESRQRHVENCEFKRGDEIYGYSVFRFEEDIGIILKNITAIKRLERKVWSLHSRLLKVQEEERQRIAAELHDSVGQTILGAKLNFKYFAQSPDKPEKQFTTGLELIDRASQELREIYTNLYPSTLRELGLESAVREFAGTFLAMSDCEAELTFELERPLGEELETNLFRIIQEIFTNIFKHAAAERVELHLRQEADRVVLTVQDDGEGFLLEEARTSGGFGLANIARRAEDFGGETVIQTTPGKGTSVTITIHRPETVGRRPQADPIQT